MKKKLLLLMIIFVCIVSCGAFTVSAEYSNGLSYVITDGEITITDCSHDVTSIAVPEKIDGYSVTAIGKYAFEGCRNLTSITIPNSVNLIGEDAFADCTGLTSVHISDLAAWCGIEFKGGSFAEGYPYVHISYSNPLYYANLYLNGEAVENLVIPDGVTKIGDYAFYGYKNLKSVCLPDSVISIGKEAFLLCSNITDITLANGITAIGESAFFGCGIKNISVPSSVANIGDWAFANCQALSNFGVDIANVDFCSVDGNLFSKDKTKLICYAPNKSESKYIIPNGITQIEDFAFQTALSLKEITIPDSVTNIGKLAFAGCSSLTSLIIPDSVTNIGDYAFRNCPALEYISFGSEIKSVPFLGDGVKLKYIGLPQNFENMHHLNPVSSIDTVFYAGDDESWNKIENNPLSDKNVICNANKKTYKFNSGYDEQLPDITDYAVLKSPELKDKNKKLFGWYETEDLSSSPVSFPYCGSAETLYASWEYKPTTSTSCKIAARGEKIFISELKYMPEKVCVALACYNNNKLVDFQYVTNADENVHFVANADFTSAKIMVWKSFESMIPVCEAEIVK